MSQPAAQPDSAPLLQVRFNDVDHIGDAAGWDLGFRQLCDGPPEIPARLRLGQHVSVMDLHFNRAFHQRGTPPAGSLTFGLPLAGFDDWCGRAVDGPTLLNFNQAGGLDGVSVAGFRGMTLSVEENYLAALAADQGLTVPDDLATPASGRRYRNCEALGQLRGVLSRVLSHMDAAFDEEAEAEIARALLAVAYGDAGTGERSQSSHRSQALRRAVAFIDEHYLESPSVHVICRHAGVSWRTLDRAFKERFGIGPKAYLQRRRLLGVRSDLIKPGRKLTISDVANANGFWHMGQFARDYRRLFGELPSETLNRR